MWVNVIRTKAVCMYQVSICVVIQLTLYTQLNKYLEGDYMYMKLAWTWTITNSNLHGVITQDWYERVECYMWHGGHADTAEWLLHMSSCWHISHRRPNIRLIWNFLAITWEISDLYEFCLWLWYMGKTVCRSDFFIPVQYLEWVRPVWDDFSNLSHAISLIQGFVWRPRLIWSHTGLSLYQSHIIILLLWHTECNHHKTKFHKTLVWLLS